MKTVMVLMLLAVLVVLASAGVFMLRKGGDAKRRSNNMARALALRVALVGALFPLLLLTSGLTLTIAHHALIAGQRSKTIAWMCVTVILGASFVCVQAYEYHHAYTELNLKLSSGIFGSTFFMLTGFHGFHVFVGMLMLSFITLRLMKGHFTPQRPFGFEGAAW